MSHVLSLSGGFPTLFDQLTFVAPELLMTINQCHPFVIHVSWQSLMLHSMLLSDCDSLNQVLLQGCMIIGFWSMSWLLELRFSGDMPIPICNFL